MITSTRLFPRPFFAASPASNALAAKFSNWKWLAALVAIAISFLDANAAAT